MATRWGEIREWMNVGAAIGTVFIGVATFWLTVNVSGLEDYFHSEVRHKNDEISSASKRAAAVADQADRAQRDLARLQTSQQALIADIFSDQAKYAETMQRLESAEHAESKASDAVIRASLRQDELQAELQGEKNSAQRSLDQINAEKANALASLVQMANFAIPLSVTTYLIRTHAAAAAEFTSPYFPVLFDPNDPGFADVSGKGVGAFFFFTDSGEDIGDDRVRKFKFCRLHKDQYLVGLKMSFSANLEMKENILGSDNKLYDKLCEMLSIPANLYASNGSRIKGNFLQVDALGQGASNAPFIAFLPDRYGAMDFEDLKVRGFWTQALSSMTVTRKINEFANVVGDPVGESLEKNGEFAASFGTMMEDMKDVVEKDSLFKPDTPFAAGWKKLQDDWEGYWQFSSVSVGGHMVPLWHKNQYAAVLPRAKFETLDLEVIANSGALFKQFDHSVMCMALNFAVSENYVSKEKISYAEECDLDDSFNEKMSSSPEFLLRRPSKH